MKSFNFSIVFLLVTICKYVALKLKRPHEFDSFVHFTDAPIIWFWLWIGNEFILNDNDAFWGNNLPAIVRSQSTHESCLFLCKGNHLTSTILFIVKYCSTNVVWMSFGERWSSSEHIMNECAYKQWTRVSALTLEITNLTPQKWICMYVCIHSLTPYKCMCPFYHLFFLVQTVPFNIAPYLLQTMPLSLTWLQSTLRPLSPLFS